jgi:hypothetical protein
MREREREYLVTGRERLLKEEHVPRKLGWAETVYFRA